MHYYTHVTSPPMTAVRRVDFLLQTPIVSGEINNATAVESAPSQPVEINELIKKK